ncbi:MAG: outer membrane lipoprotein carrier protein LolA [Ignavibacteriaceae bacterium]
MKSLFLLVLFSFLTVLNAQDSGNQLLKSVQDKFNSVEDLSADVKQVVNGKTSFSGKVYFKKDNKFRVELKNSTLISDGSTTWNYSKNDKKVVIDLFDTSNPSALSINTIINEYPAKSNVITTSENGQSVLVLTPKNDSGRSFNEVKLWVNKDNLVEKVTVAQTSGKTMNIEITNYKLNQNIPDSQFSFNPPQGTTVIDLR